MEKKALNTANQAKENLKRIIVFLRLNKLYIKTSKQKKTMARS